eukprot:CAMPEP_0171167174 /NCGR_PEP_ID=MMETSP0790-20130122/7069_1 /TAXON_ID=2925 /ORGANISM="Alexandrium catenella, Strain OF101" /LENGTH=369 /DNA_ID=CAMNT_0011631995 /DNA_START=1 /DNA_END=1111 /DNA_ORIENTATION=+
MAFAVLLGSGASEGDNEVSTTAGSPDSGHWLLASDGQACDVACARQGKLCSEDHWPETPAELSDIASAIGHPCEDIQSGDVGYDPSMDGAYCGWRSNMGVPEEGHETRCRAMPPWSTQRFCYCHGVLETTTMPFFDCIDGLGHDNGGSWSDHKRQWCCQHQGLGCTTTSAPFDCLAGLSNWQRGWSEPKKDWCCRNQNRGCVTTTIEFTKSTTRAMFDCGTGYANWMHGWSDSKKDWCCRFENVGCTTITTTTTLPYDCDVVSQDWSKDQRDWCCNWLGKGCLVQVAHLRKAQVAEAAYDCQTGYSTWRSAQLGWPKRKKDGAAPTGASGAPLIAWPATATGGQAGPTPRKGGAVSISVLGVTKEKQPT